MAIYSASGDRSEIINYHFPAFSNQHSRHQKRCLTTHSTLLHVCIQLTTFCSLQQPVQFHDQQQQQQQHVINFGLDRARHHGNSQIDSDDDYIERINLQGSELVYGGFISANYLPHVVLEMLFVFVLPLSLLPSLTTFIHGHFMHIHINVYRPVKARSSSSSECDDDYDGDR